MLLSDRIAKPAETVSEPVVIPETAELPENGVDPKYQKARYDQAKEELQIGRHGPKEEKALDDPLGTAIKAFYNIEEIPANIDMSNPKVLITPQLFLCLIAKDKVTNEDLWTSRQMDGGLPSIIKVRYIPPNQLCTLENPPKCSKTAGKVITLSLSRGTLALRARHIYYICGSGFRSSGCSVWACPPHELRLFLSCALLT